MIGLRTRFLTTADKLKLLPAIGCVREGSIAIARSDASSWLDSALTGLQKPLNQRRCLYARPKNSGDLFQRDAALVREKGCLSSSFAANKKRQLQQNYDLFLQHRAFSPSPHPGSAASSKHGNEFQSYVKNSRCTKSNQGCNGGRRKKVSSSI